MPDGDLDPAFADVREAFAWCFEEHREQGAALAVHADGRLVVDLWGGAADPAAGRDWDRDTMSVVYSTTKGIAALAVAVLVGRGALDYDLPVATWWPEFAANGKERVTLADVLSHQSGLAGLDTPLTLAEIADPEVLAARLAAQAPLWAPGTAHGYHAMTFGFYLGEIVRRVDGRSIGTFIAEELSAPCSARVFVGLPEQERVQLAELLPMAPGSGMTDLQRPIAQAFMDPTSITSKSMMLVPELAGGMTSPKGTRLEMASANGVADARGLAAIYDAAMRGQLCPPEVLARAATTVVDGDDVVLFERTAFGLGFMKPATSFFGISPNETAYGHPGSGGSFAFADPEAGITVAYVTNTMLAADGDRRAATVLDAVRAAL